MSKPNPKKGIGRTLSRPSQISEDISSGRITPINKSELDGKDEMAPDADNKIDHKSVDDPPPPKPQSAGSIVRDAAQKLLGLAMKQEWSSIEPVIKVLEKVVAANSESVNLPLSSVMDPVSGIFIYYYMRFHW